MAQDPINTVAQIWLWRLEAKIAAGAIAAAAGVIWLIVYLAAGDDASEIVVYAFFLGCGAVVVGAVIWAILILCRPEARFRKADKAVADYYRRADAVARGDYSEF